MNETLANLEAQALKLTLEERAELVHRLIDSNWENESLEDAWERAIGRRCAAIDGGENEMLDAGEAIECLRQQMLQSTP